MNTTSSSEEYLRAIIEYIPDAIVISDSEGHILRVNAQTESMFGYSRDLLIGKPIETLIPNRFRQRHVAHRTNYFANPSTRPMGTGLELYGQRTDGSEFPVDVSLSPLQTNDAHYIAVIRDITEKVRIQEQIRGQFKRLRSLRTIDLAITASLDLRLTLTVFLEQVTSQLNVDAAGLLLFNPHTQTLEYADGRGFHSDAITQSRLRVGEGYAGRAVLERCTVNIPDLAAVNDFTRNALLGSEHFVVYYGTPLVAKGSVKGLLEIFHRSPLSPDSEWHDFLETLAGQAAIAIDNTQLFDSLQRSNADLTLAYDTTLEGWARALELRSIEIEGHTRRVTELTLRLARAMGTSEPELRHVRRGALLHDIGKIGVPDCVLLKPGPLTDEEWEIMRKHPVYAYEMLSPITYLRPALDIPYCHHEKWDGTGYPRGLVGEQIPRSARIFAVVDVWDALRSERPYRMAWAEDKVVEHIESQAGEHFYPQAVQVFLSTIHEL